MNKNSLKNQVGGDHYKRMKIQPIEYILANNLGFTEGSVVKYVSRWEDKNGVEDLKKARHLLDLKIEALEKSTLVSVSLTNFGEDKHVKLKNPSTEDFRNENKRLADDLADKLKNKIPKMHTPYYDGEAQGVKTEIITLLFPASDLAISCDTRSRPGTPYFCRNGSLPEFSKQLSTTQEAITWLKTNLPATS